MSMDAILAIKDEDGCLYGKAVKNAMLDDLSIDDDYEEVELSVMSGDSSFLFEDFYLDPSITHHLGWSNKQIVESMSDHIVRSFQSIDDMLKYADTIGCDFVFIKKYDGDFILYEWHEPTQSYVCATESIDSLSECENDEDVEQQLQIIEGIMEELGFDDIDDDETLTYIRNAQSHKAAYNKKLPAIKRLLKEALLC